jgi:ubiquinol-cytochrome c reductase cytochrome c1 subunit
LCVSDDHVPSIDLGWDHHGAMSAYDAKGVRRGFQVYKEVCASCHSLQLISFRNLVEYGAWSEAEVKAMAEDEDVVDGPNDQGEMFERPGKLSDPLPRPYA